MRWYEIENASLIDSPALLIYKDRVQANIDHAIEKRGSAEMMRPHVKTHKSIEVTQMMMSAGISKFKFSTIAEGEMLGIAGVEDALMAYQPVGPKAHRLLALYKKYPKTAYSCLIDNATIAQRVSDVFALTDQSINVFLDLDVGMGRTGIVPDLAVDLFKTCKNLPNINPVGLHVYDGHIRDEDFATRKYRSDAAYKKVQLLAQVIEKEYPIKLQIITGGSPTFPVHALRKEVYCSPGTFVYWDMGYKKKTPDQQFLFAGLVMCRIISLIGDSKVCVDLGHKSIASENPFPRVYFLNLPDAKQVGHSEEHLVLDVGENSKLNVGDVLYGVPHHICPTVALHDKAQVVVANKVVDQWKVIARDRVIEV